MELVYFTLVAVALYVVSDRIVNLIERRRGERLEHRSLVFFAIIFVLSVLSFNVIQRFAGEEEAAGGVTAGDTAPGAGSDDGDGQ